MDGRILCRRNKTGSFSTQANRQTNLDALLRPLAERHPKLRAANLQASHVAEMVRSIRDGVSPRTGKPLSVGRQKNLLATLRWLLERLGKSNLLPHDNASLGIERRDYLPTRSRAVVVSDALIEEIEKHDHRVATSLRLAREFGLRFEEALKLRPTLADAGNELVLQGSWTKGNVPRRVPILNASQRDALDRAHAVAGEGSLIPPGITYVKHRDYARRLLAKFGVNRIHGARHEYAQRRYAELAGMSAPLAGGPTRDAMTEDEGARDKAARLTLSRELGHNRTAVTNAYLGGARRPSAPSASDNALASDVGACIPPTQIVHPAKGN